MSLCGLWSTFYRCRFGKVVSLALIITFSGLYVQAHHESLAAPEREYLKLVSLHPFKDKVVHNNDYDFYITVVESAPQFVDVFFYVENKLFKRPVYSVKEILLYPDGSLIPEHFTLQADVSGVSSLRYYCRKPFEGLIKVTTIDSAHKPLSVEAFIQIGSPGISRAFIIIFTLIIISVLISGYLVRIYKARGVRPIA